MTIRTMTILACGAALATPALAQDRTAYQAIAAGDYAAAAHTLEAERRIFPDRPELMLNLAALFGRAGRAGEARALYGAVMERPQVAMDMPDGTVLSSHDVAARGLAQLTALAAR